ncbi:hypothetical protein [Kineococcus rubinsiae]|uniref:hypothetical protein n=1 Tax=Kineococcus rubinsiae TaxID=2609562 RepID=UPI001431A6D3|nr:hypothetical protein [Kineococcus rubinsiae]NIZ91729.1 hypothetical protein [Kineococcus rubinsiae]
MVGTLRSEVVGVDIDSPTFAGEILDTLVAFCCARGLWHLVRPSGGADGRAHLLLVPGVRRAELEDLVLRLRRELGRKGDPVTGRRAAPLGRHHVDVRQQLRPLSAPHRCKPTPPLDEDVLATALTDLSDVLQALSPRIREARDGDGACQVASPARSRRSSPTPAPAAAGLMEPLSPLPRPRQDLPAGWVAYLHTGRSAAAEAGLDREPGSRSTIEYDATRALVLAGWSEDQAWQAIAAAHRSAFVKARSKGRQWWWHVWNAAVAAADAWLSEHRAVAAARGTSSTAVDEAVGAAIARADAELEGVWRAWPAQSRHTRRELYRYVLERMRRRGATAVPLPQRDVLLDAAIDSRNTVATARDALIAAGLLEVVSTHQRGSTDTADTWCLPPRFSSPTTTPDPEDAGGGVGGFEPTRGTPPHPAARLPLALRRSLGLPRAHLLEAVRAHRGPVTPAVLAYAAGITTSPRPPCSGLAAPDAAWEAALTREQERTMRGHLQALGAHQLVSVDADGRWTATDPASVIHDAAADQDAGAARLEHVALEQLGRDRQDTIWRAVASERREYRAAVDPTARRHRWEAQRQQVLARQAKVDLARQKAWWDGLDDHARRVQTTAGAAVFAALSPTEQAQRKHQLAVRRARAGLVERDRHTAWWNGLSSQEQDKRSVTRAWAYQRLPEDTRASLAGVWSEHRTRWDLPQPRRAPSSLAAPVRPDVMADLVIDLTGPPEGVQDSLLDLLTTATGGQPAGRELVAGSAR